MSEGCNTGAERTTQADGVRPAALSWMNALAVFGLALGLRVWHLLALRRSPFFDVLMGDSVGYHEWAQRIAGGDWLGDQVFYQAPLYPYFLGALYAAFSDDLLVVRLAQAVLGSLSCALLALASARFLRSRTAGVLAGSMLAVYAPAIFHDGLIQKSALDLFWMTGLLWWLSRIQDEPRRGLAWAAGLSLGALTLTRENAGILLLPTALWLWIHFRREARFRLGLVAALVAGFASVLLPVVIRNYSISGDFHLTTSQFGTNFYLGNNASADGTYQALRFGRGDARNEREDAASLAEEALGRPLDPGEVSNYWTGQALGYMKDDPLAWLTLTGHKFTLLVNATELVDTEDQYTYAKWSPVLRVSGALLHFGVVAPLALLGCFATWQRRDRLWLLYLMAATYGTSVLLFYVFARYRLPLVPFVILAAAAALADVRRLPARIAETPRGRLAAMAAALGGLALLCNWPFVDRAGMGATSYYNLGIGLRDLGDHRAALGHYRSALEIVPDYPEAHWAAGISLAVHGELDAAIASYRAAIALRPDIGPLHQSLADALSSAGDIKGAIPVYQEAIRLEPDLPMAQLHLALALAASNRTSEGGRHAQRAVELDSELLEQLLDTAWRRATAPGVGSAKSLDGLFALRLARWAAKLSDPPTWRSLDVLAASYAAAGRFDPALRIARHALRLATEAGDSQHAAAVSQRIARYEKGLPFVGGG